MGGLVVESVGDGVGEWVGKWVSTWRDSSAAGFSGKEAV